MHGIWLLPLAAALVGSAGLVVMQRRVAQAARALRRSAAALDRVAVAVDDLRHEARGLERTVRRMTRR